TFARTAKAARAGRRLRNQISFQVGDRDQRVVERRGDIHDTVGNMLLVFLAKDLLLSCCGCFCHKSILLSETTSCPVPSSSRWWPGADPCECARWCAFAVREPAIRD